MAYSVENVDGSAIPGLIVSGAVPSFGDELVVEREDGKPDRYRVIAVEHRVPDSRDPDGTRHSYIVVLVEHEAERVQTIGSAMRRFRQ